MCSKPAAPPPVKESPPPPTEMAATLQAKDTQRQAVANRKRSGFESTLLTDGTADNTSGNLLKPTLGA